jgi:hypothetical protein
MDSCLQIMTCISAEADKHQLTACEKASAPQAVGLQGVVGIGISGLSASGKTR